MEQRVRQVQQTSLALTTAMQQSLAILRMPGSDVLDLLAAEAAVNPFLEVRRAGGGDDDFIARVAAGGPTLQQHLQTQIGQEIRDPVQSRIAEHLLTAVAPTGWLDRPLEDLAVEARCSPAVAEAVLARLQQLDPPGVFARDLRECLMLQATEAEVLDPGLAALLDNLPLLAAKGPKAVADLCGLSADAISQALTHLRGFNPKPGLAFDYGDGPITPPDLTVRQQGAAWVVEVNGSMFPEVVVTEDAAVARGGRAVALAEMRAAIGRARNIARAVNSRKATLLDIAIRVVARQHGFLERGPIALVPMTMAEIAQEMELNISTVSRAVAGCRIQTPRGTLPLRIFFSRPIAISGDSVAARGSVTELIREIIAKEDPRAPLIDAEIMARLKISGVSLCRRAVTKHRKILGLGTAEARRRV